MKTPRTKICETCKNEFTLKYTWPGYNPKTCSLSCSYKARGLKFTGRVVSEESKEKMRLAQAGRPGPPKWAIEKARRTIKSKEYSEKRKEFYRENPHLWKEKVEKLIKYNTGRKRTPEEIKNLLESKKEYFKSDKAKEDTKTRVVASLNYRKDKPKFQAGPENHSSKIWRLRSPLGKVYIFKNMRHFIEQNSNLFDPEDVMWRNVKRINKKGKTIHEKKCRALFLASLRPSKIAVVQHASWKGWTWYSEEEKVYNDGRDLLNRSILESV